MAAFNRNIIFCNIINGFLNPIECILAEKKLP